MKIPEVANDQVFNPQYHLKLKQKLHDNYRDFIFDLRDDFKKGFSTDVLDPDFLDQLEEIIFDENLLTYSPLKFYWMNLVDNLIYLIQLHEELILEENSDKRSNEGEDQFSDIEDELFSFWQESDLAEAFITAFNETQSLFDSSISLMPLLENQIISFYFLHIGEAAQKFDDPFLYQVVPEIGDGQNQIYLKDKHYIVKLPHVPESFPTIPILGITQEKSKLTIETSTQIKMMDILNPPSPLKINSDLVYVLGQNDDHHKNSEHFKQNIKLALNNIKTAAPHLYDTFFSFTQVIIPIDEPGIVSYSMQSLPGYSSINMFERDRIDLMDDLLHENGHHYLNTYLNFTDLISEDDEKIYYSPWRNALRPVRGIYHATFTFYWALELFHHLNQSIELSNLKFSKEETAKIKSRFVEEFWMLEYCYTDLKHAFKNKKINETGMKLIESIYSRIFQYQKAAEKVALELKTFANKDYFNRCEHIKTELLKMKDHYQKALN